MKIKKNQQLIQDSITSLLGFFGLGLVTLMALISFIGSFWVAKAPGRPKLSW
jgi:hypothetical protein